MTEADGLDAVSLKMSIFNVLRKCNINPQKMVGQGYDGSSAMIGDFRGVQSLVRMKSHMLLYKYIGHMPRFKYSPMRIFRSSRCSELFWNSF